MHLSMTISIKKFTAKHCGFLETFIKKYPRRQSYGIWKSDKLKYKGI
jgi:hypothetical protein